MKVIPSLLWALVLTTVTVSAADQTGSTEGWLTSKGEYFLQVTPEGSESAVKFVPVWKGGLPKDGGAFDKETLTSIKDVKVGSKIRVDWKQDEFKRIVKVAVLEQPKPPVMARPVAEPDGHGKAATGTIAGTVSEKRGRRLFLKTPSGDEAFFWPMRNGEPDREAIQRLGEIRVGEALKVEWEQVEGRRVILRVHHGD